MKKTFIPIGILLSGLFYIFLIETDNPYILLITKLLPMILIILYASQQTRLPNTILIGLIICAIGDALIMFSFILGLSAFLIGHLFYIFAFFKMRQYNRIYFFTFIPFLAFGVLIGVKLITSLTNNGEEALILPVLLYLIIISLMGYMAFQTQKVYLYFGSVLFIISDTVLAWNKFIAPISYSGEIIMITYYSAQFLIAHSLTVREYEINKAPIR